MMMKKFESIFSRHPYARSRKEIRLAFSEIFGGNIHENENACRTK